MIVISCESYEAAKELFDAFVFFLRNEVPEAIVYADYMTNCVETDDDLRYIFIDYHYADVFIGKDNDIIDFDEFFYGLDVFYHDER